MKVIDLEFILNNYFDKKLVSRLDYQSILNAMDHVCKQTVDLCTENYVTNLGIHKPSEVMEDILKTKNQIKLC